VYPPPEILARCEFLELLSDCTLSDYQSLIDYYAETWPRFDPRNASLYLISDSKFLAEKKATFKK
jgi:hypothetical protein